MEEDDQCLYRFLFAAIPHDVSGQLIEHLECYMSEENAYIVALEKCHKTHKQTNGEHYHFALQMTGNDFNAFIKKVIKGIYGCTGKAGKGPYYGVQDLKKVRSTDKFISYSCKDQNIIYKNLKPEELAEYIKNSYQKKEAIIEELMSHLSASKAEYTSTQDTISTANIELSILKFHMEKGKRICKSQLKNLVLTYLQLHFEDRWKHLETIYFYTINN